MLISWRVYTKTKTKQKQNEPAQVFEPLLKPASWFMSGKEYLDINKAKQIRITSNCCTQHLPGFMLDLQWTLTPLNVGFCWFPQNSLVSKGGPPPTKNPYDLRKVLGLVKKKTAGDHFMFRYTGKSRWHSLCILVYIWIPDHYMLKFVPSLLTLR